MGDGGGRPCAGRLWPQDVACHAPPPAGLAVARQVVPSGHRAALEPVRVGLGPPEHEVVGDLAALLCPERLVGRARGVHVKALVARKVGREGLGRHAEVVDEQAHEQAHLLLGPVDALGARKRDGLVAGRAAPRACARRGGRVRRGAPGAPPAHARQPAVAAHERRVRRAARQRKVLCVYVEYEVGAAPVLFVHRQVGERVAGVRAVQVRRRAAHYEQAQLPVVPRAQVADHPRVEPLVAELALRRHLRHAHGREALKVVRLEGRLGHADARVVKRAHRRSHPP